MRRSVLAIPLLLVLALLVVVTPSASSGAPLPVAASQDGKGKVTWLCRPGLKRNPCEIPTDTTARKSAGRDRVYTPARKPQAKRPIDCFYVYPTVSNQPTPTATKAKDPEIISIAKYQAARFSTRCRVFAPVYRQTTLAGIATFAAGGGSERGYADVLQAWRTYLKRFNGGRGVVLIGHSQGTIVLRELIRNEIDRRPSARRKLVGALLLGGNVTVAEGRSRGGDFRNVKTCEKRGQVGCVVAYSTYSTDPLVAFFGNSDTDSTANAVSGPSGAGFEVACTDPARLSGRRQPLGVTVPSEPFAPGPINVGIAVTTLGMVPSAETTWVRPPERFRGSCRTVNGANVYRYDPLAGGRRPVEFPPTWGTHLLDVNLGLEHLTTIVRKQTKGWLAR